MRDLGSRRVCAFVAGAIVPLGECDFAVRDGGQRAADFSRVPQFRRQDSAEGFAELAEIVCHWRMAGRSLAMAPDIHVDLHRDRADLSRLPAFQRELPAGVVHAPGYSGRVAYGEALFLFWAEARGARSL